MLAQVLLRQELLLEQQELMLLLQHLQGGRIGVVGQEVSHLWDELLTLLQPSQDVRPDDPLVLLYDLFNIGHGRQLNCISLGRCLRIASARTFRVAPGRSHQEVLSGILKASTGDLLA